MDVCTVTVVMVTVNNISLQEKKIICFSADLLIFSHLILDMNYFSSFYFLICYGSNCLMYEMMINCNVSVYEQ